MKTRIKELRTQLGLTQQQLADLVHVSNRTIISIEKEQYSPSHAGLSIGPGLPHHGGGAVLSERKQRMGGSML